MKSFVSAKTKNQKNYILSMIENDITLCEGPPGVGKDRCALGLALEHLYREDKQVDKIYISRPMVATARRDFPYLKGDLHEKCIPYMMPMVSNIVDMIGNKEFEKLLHEKKIIMSPLELMRGQTLENCFAVFSEMQNSTIDQIVMAITRIGENCKMIFNGDLDQTDLQETNGLQFLMKKLGHRDDLVGIARLELKDIQRNRIIAEILKEIGK